MAQYEAFRRYALIFTRVNQGNFPSFREIQGFLEFHEIKVSSRSVQRDIEQLRTEFGIEIFFDRAKNGYFLDKDCGRYLEIFLRFLNAVQNAQALADCLKEGAKILKSISIESEGGAGGAFHLPLLLKAIHKHHLVTFVHENFFKGRKKEHVVRPYLVKEYERRWYLIGNYHHGDDLWAFGLDRVTDLKLMGETFHADDHPDPASLFASIIGVSGSDETPEEVILSLSPDQGKYFKTVPLHHSQRILIDNAKEFRFSVRVVLNYELTQRIFMLGSSATVIKPASLVKEIRDTFKDALGNYR